MARQCASLLLSHNAYDRASSARALGEVGSKASLPFLLEALYDTELIVRTEAVTSLGTLKMPSAIGALLDMARRHPEMSCRAVEQRAQCLLGRVLRFLRRSIFGSSAARCGRRETLSAARLRILIRLAAVEALPEWFEDEELSEALARLQDADVKRVRQPPGVSRNFTSSVLSRL